MERHVLVVFPHPDDESFAAGGTIALHRQQGVPVTYACGTLGEMGRNMGNPFFANRESLPLLRKQELHDACEVLGINDLRMLGLRDKTIEFEDPEKVADLIESLIHELNPSLIITFYPGESVHPDHDALAEAVIRAVMRLPKEKRPVVNCLAITKNREEILGKPDVVIDISHLFEIKLSALRAHRTQTEGMLKKWEAKLAEDPTALDEWKKEIFWTYKFDV